MSRRQFRRLFSFGTMVGTSPPPSRTPAPASDVGQLDGEIHVCRKSQFHFFGAAPPGSANNFNHLVIFKPVSKVASGVAT